MHLLRLSDIQIPKGRQRQQFDEEEILDLAESIERNGLINALTISDGNILRAGERRFRAIQHLESFGKSYSYAGNFVPRGMVPTVNLGELSEIQRFEVELDENIKRKDLTFQERALALKRRQELLALQSDGIPPTSADITEHVYGTRGGGQSTMVRKSLIVAEHLDKPEIQRAKTLDEAFNILKAQQAQEKRRVAGEALPSAIIAKQHRLFIGDFRQVYQGPPADIILTDPPYGMAADSFESNDVAKGFILSHAYADPVGEEWQNLMHDFILFCNANSMPNAHLYCFCDLDNFHWLRDSFAESGWLCHRTPLVYLKPWTSCSRIPNGIRRTYELVLFAKRSTARPLNFILPDSFTVPAEPNLGHAAQKPVAAYVNLLERSYKPGDVVLDPFCGSGPVFPAAHSLKCTAYGCEQLHEFASIAAKRLEELK